MNINLLAIIIIAMLVWGIIRGYKKGLIDGVITIISSILGLIILAVLINGIGNFINGSWMGVIMAFIVLFVINIINKVFRLITDLLKIVRYLPVGKTVDKITGAALGFVQALFVVWAILLMFDYYDFMNLNEWIMLQVHESEFVNRIYYSNYIAKLLM